MTWGTNISAVLACWRGRTRPGSVKIVLAAGNVTSTIPWTSAGGVDDGGFLLGGHSATLIGPAGPDIVREG